ncbi:hypothetical protein KR044_010224 [Drosophila immigrans]|nr:hypothetical protein KR044_010224 [Drosophila immigrans]
MVKVQKPPQPKSLSKTQKIEGVSKEKLKASKDKKKTAAKVVAAEVVADIKKSVKKSKEIKNVTEKPVKKAAEKPSKAPKKPMVLAPPPSPAAAAPKAKGGKKALVAATPASPVAATPKPKAGKKPLVVAPTPSPVAPVVRKTKGGKKTAAEPLDAPAPPIVAATKAKGGKKSAPTTAPVTKKEKKPESTVTASKPESQKKQPQLAKPAKKLANGKAVKPVAKKLGKVAKNKVAAKKENEVEKKHKKVLDLKYELKPFDEEQFFSIVSAANVQKVCDALKTQVAEEVKKQKAASIFKDYRYILQVCSYKIPSCPKRVVKLPLKHSLISSDDDVAVIVTDLQRGARFDYEPTVQHYEDLFREAGVEQKLTVVPFNRLRNDVGTFEAKRKFLNTYDYLLCDGRISGQANAFLGQGTQKPRHVLHAVRLSKDDELPKEITRALCRTAYRQLNKGDLIAIPVGNHEFSGKKLAENVVTVVNQLQQLYPGGLANIRSLYLKIDMVGTSALPLYISLCSPPADAPYVVGPREQRMLKLKKQANEVLSRFALTKDVGFVKLTDDQVKYKAEVRAKRLALQSADAKDENEEEEAAVPAKKARKEAAVKAVEAEDDQQEEEEDDDEDVEEDEDDDDEDDDDDDDDDGEDDDE